MKKLLFTAFAVVAFNGVAKAETCVSAKKLTVDLLKESCTDVYHETYIEFVNLGLEEEAAGEAFAAYKDCKGLN